MPNLFDLKLVFTQIPKLLEELPVTLELVFFALIISFLLGVVIALIRVANVPVLSKIAVAFVSLMRGTPIIVQLYATYFGIPIFLRYVNYYRGTEYNVNGIPGIVFAIIALGLNHSAFDSETIRSAILSVDKGQIEAGKALGMSNFQVFRRIIFPQAGEVALLPLGNSIIGLIKGTSLAFSCGVVEMTAVGKILAGRNYRYFEVYVSLGIIYWVITLVLEFIIKRLEKKVRVPKEAPELKAEELEALRKNLQTVSAARPVKEGVANGVC